MNGYHALLLHLLVTGIAAMLTTSWACNVGSDVTTFPACNSFLDYGDSCATVLDRPGKQDCLCNQQYLDSLYGCENELRLCFLNNDLDSTFESAVLSWDSLCDAVVTFSPTTPTTSAFTARPDALCAQVQKACATAENLLNDCLSYAGDENTSMFSACTCRPQLLSLDYSCEYIGNATCLSTDVALSSLYGYSGCDNFASVIGTGLPPVGEPTVSDFPTLPGPTAEPSSTISHVQTTSVNGSPGRRQSSALLVILSTVNMVAFFNL